MNVNTLFEGMIAVGTIAVAILAIWGDWFRIKLISPKLKLIPYNLRGNVTTARLIVGGQQTGNSFTVIYYHLKIINDRKWITVKNCRVMLIALHRKGPDGQFHQIPIIFPGQYIWTPSEWAPIERTFNDEAVLDFGKIAQGFNRFEPTLYVVSNNFMGFVGANEVVRYTLRVVADNYISSNTQTFEVAWDGLFNDNLDIMERCLVVSEVFENISSG